MLGSAELWAEVAPQFVERAQVRIGRIDLDESTAELAASVLVSAPPRFALAGHSLGGIVALEVASRAPERVTRLALLAASARPPTGVQLGSWTTLGERTRNGSFAEVARELAAASLPARRRSDAALAARVEAMAHAVGPAGFLRQLAAQRSRSDLRRSLSRVAAPTLVLSGGDDEVCPPQLQEEIAAGIAGARHETLEGVGHIAPLEAPDEVAAQLLAWLSAPAGGLLAAAR